MTDLDALTALLAAATTYCEQHMEMEHVNQIPPCAGARHEAEWWAEAFRLPALIEAARREEAARFVAEYWRGEYMEGIEAGDSKWAIGTHPLAMVLAALDGETEPRQLGLPETADDAFRSNLAAARAALPAERTE